MRMIVPLLALFALATAGCAAPGGFQTPEQDAQGRYVIEATADNRFVPAQAEVPEGATVVWRSSGVGHTVTARDGSFDSGTLDDGDEFEHTFDSAGDIAYYCEPHEGLGMEGVVRVVA